MLLVVYLVGETSTYYQDPKLLNGDPAEFLPHHN